MVYILKIILFWEIQTNKIMWPWPNYLTLLCRSPPLLNINTRVTFIGLLWALNIRIYILAIGKCTGMYADTYIDACICIYLHVLNMYNIKNAYLICISICLYFMKTKEVQYAMKFYGRTKFNLESEKCITQQIVFQAYIWCLDGK